MRVHFATRRPDSTSAGGWSSCAARTGAGPTVAAPARRSRWPGTNTALELVAPYASGARLMLARVNGADTVDEFLLPPRRADPLRLRRQRWPLAAYQNVYATTPGSAEMPSAGRPFTPELITALVARGVLVAPITLHTGVSSPERHEPPFPEQYEVPGGDGARSCRGPGAGGRVIAVGTTVVRALETAARPDGTVKPAAGWTDLVIDTEARGAGRRRADHRLARAAGLAPADAGRARRPGRCLTAPTAPRSSAATCGTSSATAI